MRRPLVAVLALIIATSSPAAAQREDTMTVRVRRELEDVYRANIKAFHAKDLEAVNSLRTQDYHTVTPDGVVRDRDAMTQYTLNLFSGIREWISTTMDIESLRVDGDLAIATVRQHAVRNAMRADGLVHHVETWVTQRETWRWTAGRWLLFRVDSIRDSKRLVDGKPG